MHNARGAALGEQVVRPNGASEAEARRARSDADYFWLPTIDSSGAVISMKVRQQEAEGEKEEEK